MTILRGIRWRLVRWATGRRDDVQRAMDGAPAGSLTLARLLGRRDAFDDIISHIESGAPETVSLLSESAGEP